MVHFCVDYFHGCYDFRSFCLFAIIDTFPIILMPSKEKKNNMEKVNRIEYASHWISKSGDYLLGPISIYNFAFFARCVYVRACVCLIAIECIGNKRITKPYWIDIVYCTVFIIVSLPCSYIFRYIHTYLTLSLTLSVFFKQKTLHSF